MKKTILILANSSGGLYDFRNELVLRLLDKYRVVASLPDTVRTAELAEEGVEIVETSINRRGVNPIEDLKLMKAYRKLLAEIKPDLVLTYTIKPNIYGGYCCGQKKIPYITTITGLGSTFQKPGLLRTMITIMYKAGLKKASCVFFQNSENLEIFKKYHIVESKRYHVVESKNGKREATGAIGSNQKCRLVSGSGVDLTRHQPEPYPEEACTRFLYIGRVMREKGIREYLEAAKQMHDEQTVFQILGYCDEDYEEQLVQAEKDGVVEFLGFHPEVHEYIKNASAIVLPTYHEGMSNVLMEASATARPVLASNISGCKEIFDEGVTGFGFAPENSDDLIRALQKFKRLNWAERRTMGLAARTKMEQEFDRRLVADAYLEEICNNS